MLDLSSLSSWAEILSGGGSAVVGIWKFFIAPRKRRADALSERLKKIETKLKNLEDTSEKVEKLIKEEVSSVQKVDRFEIDELKKDYENLVKTMNDHIAKVDAKNDKLLDLIIKYFTEKD